jgi:membrane protease YdiL (CAAX protease family)
MAHRPLAGTPLRLAHAIGLVVVFTVLVRWLGLRVMRPVLGFAPMGVFLLVAQLGFILGLGLFWAGRLRPRDIGWTLDRPWRDLALGAAGALVATAGLFALIRLRGEDTAEIVTTITGYSIRERLFFTLIGLQASLVEESLFRGHLQGQLVAFTGAAAGLTLTAVVFALSHLSLDLARLASLTFLVLVYGLLRGRDRSLIAPAIAHTLTWTIWGLA